ncbi:IS3 family transposase [Flavobacterium sp. HJSW_4]|uniref:IS3 family transposase n=1 Tax=Flavobacterium sp. HJSW_4 TaxID=3344660 RepID=UPI0035F4B69F
MITYERAFKVHAVKLSYDRGKGQLACLARQLGISSDSLYKWRKDYEKFGKRSFPGSGHPNLTSEQAVIRDLERKIEDSKITLEILKRGTKYVSQGKIATKNFIENNKSEFSIAKMLSVLEVSETTYYRTKKQELTDTESRVLLLKQEITSIYYEFNRRYGCFKITRELQSRGFKIKNSSVKKYMRLLGLRRIVKRKYKVTTDSFHNDYVVPNVLNRQFTVTEPARAWVSDITYIQTTKGFLYLTIVMDLFDRKIIGWCLSTKMNAKETSLPAFEMAVNNREITKNLIFHSDRGVQYANKLFSDKLSSYSCITRSMSRKENHNDNAVAESFFHSFKTELIRGNKILTRKSMRVEVCDYIENWYNKRRRHSFLEYKTIEEFNKFT